MFSIDTKQASTVLDKRGLGLCENVVSGNRNRMNIKVFKPFLVGSGNWSDPGKSDAVKKNRKL